MYEAVDRILQLASEDGRLALLEHEVYEILGAAGIETPRCCFWPGDPGEGMPDEIRRLVSELPGERVVLKIVSPQVLHKSDIGGLAFCVRDAGAVLDAGRRIWAQAGLHVQDADRRGLLVTEEISRVPDPLAGELLVTMKQDEAFGTVLVLGMGGVLTEWYGEFAPGASTVLLQPGTIRESLEKLLPDTPFLAHIFRPGRLHDTAPLDMDDVARKLESLGRLAQAYGAGSGGSSGNGSGYTIEEIEINPMLLAADGRWVAVDGTGSLSRRKHALRRRPLEKIRNLMKPRSAVVVGASARGMNPGRIILGNLKNSEGIDNGKVYAVHPKEKSIDGLPCVAGLEDLAEPVDLAVVSIPAEGARDAIGEICRMNSAAAIILIPGGFAETGERKLEGEIIRILADGHGRPGGGPVLVGGNCLGIVSKHQYNTFFLPRYKLPFHDAPGDALVMISQSGAYLVSFNSNMDGVLFPAASISYGNQMDLTVADFLEHYLSDDSVRVAACYIEGFKPLDGERFARLARAMRDRGKRVVVYKAGRTTLGAMAAQSHTASLAGDYAVAAALLRQAGAVVTGSMDDFQDATRIFAMLADRFPVMEEGKAASKPGMRTAIISNAGFECSTVTDSLGSLELAALAPATLQALKDCLPGFAHADNPVDATPIATTEQFMKAAEAMLMDPGVDAMIISPVPATPALNNLPPDPFGLHCENIYREGSLPGRMLDLFRSTSKPVVACVDCGPLYDPFVFMLQRGGLPTYRKIDRAARALEVFLGS